MDKRSKFRPPQPSTSTLPTSPLPSSGMALPPPLLPPFDVDTTAVVPDPGSGSWSSPSPHRLSWTDLCRNASSEEGCTDDEHGDNPEIDSYLALPRTEASSETRRNKTMTWRRSDEGREPLAARSLPDEVSSSSRSADAETRARQQNRRREQRCAVVGVSPARDTRTAKAYTKRAGATSMAGASSDAPTPRSWDVFRNLYGPLMGGSFDEEEEEGKNGDVENLSSATRAVARPPEEELSKTVQTDMIHPDLTIAPTESESDVSNGKGGGAHGHESSSVAAEASQDDERQTEGTRKKRTRTAADSRRKQKRIICALLILFLVLASVGAILFAKSRERQRRQEASSLSSSSPPGYGDGDVGELSTGVPYGGQTEVDSHVDTKDGDAPVSLKGDDNGAGVSTNGSVNVFTRGDASPGHHRLMSFRRGTNNQSQDNHGPSKSQI